MIMGGITLSDVYEGFKTLLGLEFALIAVYSMFNILNLIRMDHDVMKDYEESALFLNAYHKKLLEEQKLIEEESEKNLTEETGK
ncbi:MAG: hypothetical protein IEMM0002_0422 [bacterium]|nr:MAG: hypothetical protein IEMM0002_0422 [bacterium]